LLGAFPVDVPSFSRRGVKDRSALDACKPPCQSKEKVEGLLMIPRAPGHSRSSCISTASAIERIAWRFAPDFAKLGIVTVRVRCAASRSRTDRPKTAGRSSSTSRSVVGGGQLRQAETEHVYLVRAIDALAALDLFGDGSHRTIHRARFGSVTRWDR